MSLPYCHHSAEADRAIARDEADEAWGEAIEERVESILADRGTDVASDVIADHATALAEIGQAALANTESAAAVLGRQLITLTRQHAAKLADAELRREDDRRAA